MQVQYSTDELVHMITGNNLPGVYARLLAEGRVNAAIPPNVDAISYAIQEQAQKLAPEAFLVWLEQLMDVPVSQNNVYATELNAIRQTTGRTPARLLVDQIRQTMPQSAPTSITALGRGDRWWAWLVIALAVVGLLCVLRYVGKMLSKT